MTSLAKPGCSTSTRGASPRAFAGLLVLPLLLLAGCGGKAAPAPAVFCSSACSVGDACQSDAACLLGTCAAGRCSLPASAPAATARATVVIGATGGAIDAVTPEGVSLHLAVPPGALAEEVSITTEPQPAGPGEWLRVAVDPPGLIFKVPAELTLTLPGGRFDDSTTFSTLAPRSGARAAFPSSRSADGRTLTAQVRALGRPSQAPQPVGPGPLQSRPGRALTLDPFWEGFFLLVAAEPVERWVPRLRALLVQLTAEGRYDDAAPLATGAEMLLQRLGSDTATWPGVAHQFWVDLQAAACGGLGAAIGRAGAAAPMCGWQAREAIKDVLAMGGLEQKVGASCGGTSSAAAVSDLIDRAVANMENPANRAAFVACECNDPVRLKAEQAGTRQRPAGCPAPPPGAQAAPGSARRVALFDHTTAPYEWLLLLETVSMAPDAFAPLHAISFGADAEAATAQLGGAEIGAVRAHAFALCADAQDSSILNELARRVQPLGAPLSAPAPDILLDAQRCGASLHVAAETASHAAYGAGAVVDYPTGPGAAPVVQPVAVLNDGMLQISGPIATLRCRDPQTLETTALEADVLRFSSASGGTSSPIDTRQANQAQDVLDAAALPFPVDVHTQLLALGLPTDAPTSFDLVIERRGPGCGVQPASTTLFTLPVQVNLRPPRTSRAFRGTALLASYTGGLPQMNDTLGVVTCQPQVLPLVDARLTSMIITTGLVCNAPTGVAGWWSPPTSTCTLTGSFDGAGSMTCSVTMNPTCWDSQNVAHPLTGSDVGSISWDASGQASATFTFTTVSPADCSTGSSSLDLGTLIGDP